MKIFLNGNIICIETNVEFALKYWSERKRHNPRITWEFYGRHCYV